MTLSEKTTIPIGIAVAIFGGAAAWMTNLATQTMANAKALEAMESRHYQYLNSIQKIEKDVAVIKTKLDLIQPPKERE
jgi:hypothetical protein